MVPAHFLGELHTVLIAEVLLSLAVTVFFLFVSTKLILKI